MKCNTTYIMQDGRKIKIRREREREKRVKEKRKRDKEGGGERKIHERKRYFNKSR